MCIERKIKHKFCYEIDGNIATLQLNGVDSFSFWKNWFCLWRIGLYHQSSFSLC